jgi:hypothetical protein
MGAIIDAPHVPDYPPFYLPPYYPDTSRPPTAWSVTPMWACPFCCDKVEFIMEDAGSAAEAILHLMEHIVRDIRRT